MSEERKMRKRKRRRLDRVEGSGGVIKRAALSVGVSLGFVLAISLLSAAILSFLPDPARITLPTGVAIYLVASALGGVFAAIGKHRDRREALGAALACGFALLIVSGVSGVTQSFAAEAYLHGVPLLLSVLGRAVAVPLSFVAANITLNIQKDTLHRRR